MTPFSGNTARSVDHPPVDDEATAASCTQNNPEYDVRILCGTIDGFGQGEAVSVVGEPHRRFKRDFQVSVERATIEPGRIGILHQASAGRNGPWDGDANLGLSPAAVDEPGC